MSTYNKASLVLIPSGTKTSKIYSQKPINGDGDFSFSRSTMATRVNESGLIEKETQNLFTYSNTFDNAAWLKSNASVTSGQTGYDGTNNAYKLIQNTSSGFHFVYQNVSNTNICTLSIYAKAGEYSGISFFFPNLGGTSTATTFNLSTGTFVSNTHNATAEAVGTGGWYRISLLSNPSGLQNFNIYVNQTTQQSEAGDGTSGIYIQDAQLEQGLVARDYIETTTSAVYGGITDNVPRIDYTDASCPSLLLEPTRTNLISHSEFIGQDISVNDLSIDNNETTSPEGLVNATMITTTATSQPRMESTVDYNSTYAISCFIKKNIGDYFGFGYYENVGGNGFVRFNISSGLDTDITYSGTFLSDGKIVSFNNDWYRISAKITTGSSTGKSGAKFVAMKSDAFHLSDIGNKYYIYGLQLEEASYETSYIPTYGTSVSRNADKPVDTPIANFAEKNFTLFVDSKGENTQSAGTSTFGYQYGGGTIFRYSSCIGYSTTSGSQYYCGDFTSPHKWALSFDYDSSLLKIFVNGVLVRTATDINPNRYGISYVKLNATGTTSLAIYNQVIIFKEALTDQEAINLTTI